MGGSGAVASELDVVRALCELSMAINCSRCRLSICGIACLPNLLVECNGKLGSGAYHLDGRDVTAPIWDFGMYAHSFLHG